MPDKTARTQKPANGKNMRAMALSAYPCGGQEAGA